ncbi:hypothetical protein CC2G_014579 [Coprinopsis cinerea AmutBmut pab1-1]|nr:hypothetical protein CC2G_014579 [Coprinopsis cinerea AmutBmut pab1-1]
MASGGDDGYLWITDLDTGSRQKVSTKQECVVEVKWLPYAQASGVVEIITAGADGTCKLWRKAGRENNFKRVASVSVMSQSIESIAFENNHLGVVGRGGVFLYRIDRSTSSGDLEETEGGEVNEDGVPRWIGFSKGGKEVMIGMLDTRVLMAWNVESQRRLWRERLESRMYVLIYRKELN